MHTLTLMITHSKMSRLILRAFCRAPWTVNFTRTNAIPSASQRNLSTDEHKEEVLIPEYQPRVGEEVEVKRARLLYQSRCVISVLSALRWCSKRILVLL